MKRMVFAPGSNHVYVGGAYSTPAGTTDAITLFDRAADGTLTRRSTPTAKDGCIAWDRRPVERAGSCRTARAIGLIKAWTMSPDGKQLYVAGDQRGIAIIDRDPTTGLLSERAVPNGCITETGRATYTSAATAGQCRVGGYALRSLHDLAVTPDGALVVAGGNFGLNSSDPVPPPRYTLGGVTALSRDASGSLTMTGCYSGDAALARLRAAHDGECATARGLDNVPYNVNVTPDGKHVYFGVGAVRHRRGSGLALFRVVASSEPAPGPGVRVDAVGTAVQGERRATPSSSSSCSRPPSARRRSSTRPSTRRPRPAPTTRARTGTATIAQGATDGDGERPDRRRTPRRSSPETFGLRITAADGAVLTEPEATASITDDDGRPPPPAHLDRRGRGRRGRRRTAPCCASR